MKESKAPSLGVPRPRSFLTNGRALFYLIPG